MDEVVDVAGLWDFEDPTGSEARLRAAAAAASGTASQVLMTQVARALALQERYDEGHAVLDAVEAGPLQGETHARVALERGRLLRSAGEPERSRSHFEDAARAAEGAGLAGLHIDALHMLALLEPTPAAQAAANRAALAAASRSGDPAALRWRASLLNNLGCALVDAGQVDQALGVFEEALRERELRGEKRETQIARWMVAWALRLQGRTADALRIQRALKAELSAAGVDDPYVDEELQILESDT